MLNVREPSKAIASVAICAITSCAEKISQGLHPRSGKGNGNSFVIRTDLSRLSRIADERAVFSSSIKATLVLRVEMTKGDGKSKVERPYFSSKPYTILSQHDIENAIEEAHRPLMPRLTSGHAKDLDGL